ncbi:metal-dependent transcriptional regulator [bacterium]|nr:metal-dependent transcriptional regulator [bacterium]
MEKNKLSSSIEDYLEVIYEQLKINKNVKAVEIAKKLKVSRASVTEALQKLSAKGYIKYEKNIPIELTETGSKIAESVALRHSVLCDFFQNTLGLEQEEAEINACKVEHVITQNAFEKLIEFLKLN